MATTKLTGRQLNFQGAAAFSGSSGASNSMIVDNVHGLVLSASRIYLSGSPADNLEAATKAYVDSVAGGGVTANQIAFGNNDGSGVSSDAGLVYNPNTDIVGVSGSIEFGGVTGNSIHGDGVTGLNLSGTLVNVTSAAAMVVASTTFDVNASGNVTVDSSAGTISIGADDVDQNINIGTDGTRTITIGEAADSTLTLKSLGGTFTLDGTGETVDLNSAALDIDASGAITIDGTSTFSIDGVGASNVTTKGALTLSGSSALNLHSDSGVIDIDSRQGAITIDSNAAGVSIDGAAASNFSTSAGALTLAGVGMDIDATGAGTLALDGAGGINIGTAASVAVDFNASTLDIDSTGALTIDSASTLSLDAAGATNLTTTSGALTVSGSAGVVLNAGTTLDIDAATAITIDSQQAGVSIDAAAASNFTISAGDLTLQTSADDGKVVIKGDAEGATSIHIDGDANASAIVDIDAGELDIDASGGINITSAENAADAIVLNASAGGIDITAAGAAGEDLDILNSAGSVSVTSGENIADAIRINVTGGGAAGILSQFGGTTMFSVQASNVRVHENVNFLLDGGYMAATGSKAWELPNYVHNSAVVTSGASAIVDYGTVTAGSGIAAAAAAGSQGKALGISLMTGSLFVLGGDAGGASALVPESLRVYQNGLLLASGSANDFEIVNYTFTSGSQVGFDVKLYTAPVVGDVFQVDVSAKMQA